MFPVVFVLWNSDQLKGHPELKSVTAVKFDRDGKTFGLIYIDQKTDAVKIIKKIKENKNTEVLFIADKPFGSVKTTFAEVEKYAK